MAFLRVEAFYDSRTGVRTLWRGLRSGRPDRALGVVDWASRIQTVGTVLVAVIGAFGLARFAEGPVGIVAGVAFLFAVLLVFSLSAVARLQTQLDRYEQPTLLLALDPQDPTCHQEFREGLNGERLAAESYRVRATNPTGRTVEHVTVSLASFTPQGAEFLPVPLRLLNDDGDGWPQSRNGRSLHPHGSTYAHLVAIGYRADGGIGGQMQLGYAAREPNLIDSGRRYEFAVIAEGRDVTPARRTFVAWVRSRRLYVCAIEDEATHPQRVTLPG